MNEIIADDFEGYASEYDDSRFINFSTLSGMGDVSLSIVRVKGLNPEFKFENGRTLGRPMLVLMFKTKQGLKGLRLNKTNLRAMQLMYGNNTKDWVGKKVVMYSDPKVKFGGKTVGGVRIKQHIKGEADEG